MDSGQCCPGPDRGRKRRGPFRDHGNLDHLVAYRRAGRRAHVTDVTNASRTMLMDLKTLDGTKKSCKPSESRSRSCPASFPPATADTWGATLKDGPLEAEVPVCGALGDQQAALVGQTCFNTGEAKNTYGTGCFLLLNTGHDAGALPAGLAHHFGISNR